MIGISLKKKKAMSLKKIEYYLSPAFTYLPIKEGDSVSIENKSVVKEGAILGRRKNSLPILSPISGVVTWKQDEAILQIENNHEKKGYKETDKSYTKEEFLSLVKEAGICGMGGAGFPTYLKYKDDNIRTLIVNAVECEPYITADFACIMENAAFIVKTIVKLMIILEIKECFIAIKAKEPLLKEKLVTLTSTHPKIKVVEVPNLYPMGWEKSLVRYIKHTDYKKLPIEKGIVVSNVSTMHAIGEALFKEKPLLERIVTFSGEKMKNPCNVHVKVGTKIKEVLDYVGGVEENSDLIVGGPMMGEILDLDCDVILPSTTSILALPKQDLREEACIKCGKCTENCPSKISPALIFENKNNPSVLKRLNPNACIACGICSYVCPSKIKVRDAVSKAKKEVREK